MPSLVGITVVDKQDVQQRWLNSLVTTMGKLAVRRFPVDSTHTLPRTNVFMYILQTFPDVLGDRLGSRDTSISLEVCRCL